jgi:L-ascorbate metabolism protein UlaG (beta-lactamase superfamily)
LAIEGEDAVEQRSSGRLTGAAVGCLLALWSVAAAAADKPVTLEFFSWSIFRLTSPEGTVILTNPFVTNPDSPVKVADFPKVDAIVVADGHRDEVGSTDEIALATGAKIITSFEMFNVWFEPRKVPVEQVLRSGPGDTAMIKGVKIRNVSSVHGSGTADKMDGGKAMGFFITFENGFTVYFAGSTDTTLDMQLWSRKYKPDVAILCLSNGRDPDDLVEQARLLRTDNPNLKTVIPHHVRLQPPPGAHNGADVEAAFEKSGLPIKVIKPEFNKVYALAK